MQNKESVLENEMQKIICDFGKQIDHLIRATRPDKAFINGKKNGKKKKNLPHYGIYLPCWPQGEKSKKRKRNMNLDVAGELNKAEDHENSNTSCNWFAGNFPEGFQRGL